MAKVSIGSRQLWNNCLYCPNLEFKTQHEFTRHLRERHCSREGGSYVCQYGYNAVCSSLPVEGVSDRDYEDHVFRHHVFTSHMATSSQAGRKGYFRKMSPQQGSDQPNVVSASEQWTVYSASQNLPAVLNDPNRGKQRDFFTKTWGDGFVEKTDIGKPSYIPDITHAHFEYYMKKIAKRYRRHTLMNKSSPKKSSSANLMQIFPNLKAAKYFEKSHFDVDSIPKIFLQPSLDLSSLDTFNEVFPFWKEAATSTTATPGDRASSSQNSGKLVQEKLTHYLDTVEVQIAHQVAQKSQSFFHAMTSHDAVMEELTQTITVVKALRKKVSHIDNALIKDSLKVLLLERKRCNYNAVCDKLKLMATVHQTQPMIQLLLSAPDYVAALDLISTTQEILLQELAGVQCFRHLGSQLQEMERLIDKMLSTEFERYATADLNRPLGDDHKVLEVEKLVSIIFGILRQKHFHFVDTYKEEAFTTIKAIVKQVVIEVVAASDCSDSEVALTGLGDQLQDLGLQDWLHLMERSTSTLLRLLHRVKAVHSVMQQAADVCAGKVPETTGLEDDGKPDFCVSVSPDPLDRFLSAEEHARVTACLQELLTSVCDCAHERLAQLVLAPSQQPGTHSSSQPLYWLVDKATALQVCNLARVIDNFADGCEKLCGRASTALKSAFKFQASKFVQRFHLDRKNKLGLILDSERWKQADVPSEFQDLVDHIVAEGKFLSPKHTPENSVSERKPGSVLLVAGEEYAVVGTVLLLLRMVAEYCECAGDLPASAPTLARQLGELLQLFNSRCCQLVLGAGALQLAGLKTITSTNLALASRALQLLLWLLPPLRRHFRGLVDAQQQAGGRGVGFLDTVEKDVQSHIQEIEGKVLTIICSLVAGQLAQWDARPPVPSQAFRNISRHLTKLHEAVSSILPAAQVHSLYRTVHRTFKDKLRDQLHKMNVVNNGGPQHGVVTSELTFYLETLKTLGALPADELSRDTMEDIWQQR